MDVCPFCDLDERFHRPEGDKLRCLPDRQVGHVKACLAIAASIDAELVPNA